MPWNDKYWDALNQIYWTPNYVGLRKLTPKADSAVPGHLVIARSDVPAGNSIYTREIKSKDMAEHLHSREETLNHVLDIGLAIAPDRLIWRLLGQPLGISDQGPFESLGREVDSRFGVTENAFQQDGFFVSPQSALALEIKLKSPSSPEQILKYACMLALEEEVSGAKQNVGLLYVVPEGAESKLWRSCGLEGPKVGPDFLENVRARQKSAVLNRLMEPRSERVRLVLSRLTLACVSWTWFRDEIAATESSLDERDAAQQCYRRLLLGLRRQIEAHSDTGLNEPAAGARAVGA